MPTYGYRCKSCEHEFETVQRITEDPLTECPKCKGPVTRLLFPVGIVFKGSGFHINDYPSSGKASKPSTPDTSTKEDSKKEKEPASTG